MLISELYELYRIIFPNQVKGFVYLAKYWEIYRETLVALKRGIN
jgi:hypothetical protein